MSAGDFVVYVADPWRYGNLIVCDRPHENVVVAQDAAGETYRFLRDELELEEEWAKGHLHGTWDAWKDAAEPRDLGGK